MDSNRRCRNYILSKLNLQVTGCHHLFLFWQNKNKKCEKLLILRLLPLYLRVPSKRVAMVSRNVFWGARRPFITGILTQTGDGQQQSGGHTIPDAQLVVSRGSQQVENTVRMTVQSWSQGRTSTVKAATLLQVLPLPKTIAAAWED